MVVAAVVGLLFGAADQYIGSLKPMVALGPWTVAVSQMSALWLLLPFAFGCTQDRPRRAMLIGLIATMAALVGYFAMTISPIEGVPMDRVPGAAVAVIGSNLLWIVGGIVTGPGLGLLGQRWRVRGYWSSITVAAGAFLFEPVARGIGGRLLGPSWV